MSQLRNTLKKYSKKVLIEWMVMAHEDVDIEIIESDLKIIKDNFKPGA